MRFSFGSGFRRSRPRGFVVPHLTAEARDAPQRGFQIANFFVESFKAVERGMVIALAE